MLVRCNLAVHDDEQGRDNLGDDLGDDFDQLEQELICEMVEVPDPLEGWNRGVFAVNDALYVWVGRPVARGYEAVMPLPVRTGIRNFLHNLGLPVRAINCLLQARWEGAGNELARFGINSTIGVLGVLDVAQDDFGITPEYADLGQTLASYGIGEGLYLVWPILGPGTLRDSAGWVGDRFMQPLNYFVPLEVRIGIGGVRTLNNGSFGYPDYDALKEDALDHYVAARQAFVQYRRNLTNFETQAPSTP
jgi:phospholipid-binding lipoprotein MlaA